MCLPAGHAGAPPIQSQMVKKKTTRFMEITVDSLLTGSYYFPVLCFIYNAAALSFMHIRALAIIPYTQGFSMLLCEFTCLHNFIALYVYNTAIFCPHVHSFTCLHYLSALYVYNTL